MFIHNLQLVFSVILNITKKVQQFIILKCRSSLGEEYALKLHIGEFIESEYAVVENEDSAQRLR